MPDAPTYDHYVLISIDTLRSDGIAANPYRLWPARHQAGDILRTPLLDKMVAEGAFFPNSISAAPYTSAAHASIFSGKWPPRHGVYEFFNRRLRSSTLFTWARRRGFHTYFKSDFPLILGPHLGFTADIDDYVVEDDDDLLSRLDVSEPTFSLIHFGSVHIPHGFHNLHYGGDAYRKRVAELERELGTEPLELSDHLVETYRSEEDLDLLIRYKQITFSHYEKGEYDLLLSLYLEGISHFMKTRFEPFMARLFEKFRGRRVLFVLFGDHGEEYDQENYGHFNSTAESVLRVPILFYGPDIAAGVHPTRIRTVDVAPTVADCMGRPTHGLDGRSLAGTVFAGESYPERPAYSQSFISDTRQFVDFQQRLLRTGRKTGSLPHVCFAEAVYDGDLKLRRQNYEFVDGKLSSWSMTRSEPRISLERIGEDLIPRLATDREATSTLLDRLDAYNRMIPKNRAAAKGDPEVTDDIRSQLRNMGYDL